jgi:DNA-binding MarR family transcriptional regulator
MRKADHLAFLVADLFEAAGAVRLVGEVLAGTAGQTQARWQVLSAVSEGDRTIATAARRLGITRQSVRRVADLLVDEGLARYDPNPRHKGSPLIRLTEQGSAALAAITDASLDWRAAVAKAMTDEDIATTRATLRTLIDRADQHRPR